MTEELIGTLLAWVIYLSPYQMPDKLPIVVEVPNSFFVQRSCKGSTPCNVTGWYEDNGIIYIEESMPAGLKKEVLFHEIVHYVQGESGLFETNSCSYDVYRELEAYKYQSLWMVQVMGALPSGVTLEVYCDATDVP